MCSSSVALLVALSALVAFASGFELNIDCGSDSTSTVKGTEWVGDTAYTQSGESMTVNNPSSPVSVMDTLRVFSTGKKGCYSVPGVPQQQVLVRASFWYMNYDGRSSPPTFNLLLENSSWDEINTDNDTAFIFTEATYVVTGGTVDVCVSQTMPDQIPFMSALEIFSTSTDMYKDFNTSTAFIMKHRNFYGGVPGSFVLDPSGRYWHSLALDIINSTSDAPSTPDNLPEGVLSRALTAENVSYVLILTFPVLPTHDVPVYITMYFSEVNPHPRERRSFDIYVGGNLSTTSGPIIVPPYGQVSNYTMHHIFANSTTEFSLEATDDSDLPPLLNAYEVYTVVSINQSVAGSGGVQTSSPSGTTKKNTLSVSFGTAVFWAVVGMYLWGAM